MSKTEVEIILSPHLLKSLEINDAESFANPNDDSQC